jgi:hypothetical protein
MAFLVVRKKQKITTIKQVTMGNKTVVVFE